MNFLLSFLFLFAGLESDRNSISGQVFSDENRRPLPMVHIITVENGEGTVTDEAGHFELEVSGEQAVLKISRMGYEPQLLNLTEDQINAPLEIYLTPAASRLDEVVISAIRQTSEDVHAYGDHHASTTEEFIQSLAGVGMIKRANYGWEPAIRGMSAGRMTVLIDDVKMTPACVDRMDPVTSYVETDNLDKVEVSRGNADLSRGSRPGGTMNLVTSRPEFNRQWFGRIEAGAQHNATSQKYSLSTGYSDQRNAVQGAFSYRQAGNYRTGRGEEIPLSGYDKMNLKLDFDRKFSPNQTGRFTYIGDLATDIGYPGLLMDTREAKSHLFSYEYEWTQIADGISSLRVKPYHTRVDHLMDDYDRDVTERTIMPDMYMPMYGETRTTGARVDMSVYQQNHFAEIGLHLHRLDAFADMLMEPLDESESDMYLYNIGDARIDNAYLSVDYSYPAGSSWTLNAAVAAELSMRDLLNDTAAGVFQAEYGDIPVANNWVGLSGSLGVNWNHQDRYMATLSLSDSERLPSHLEHYGYYIYNPVDDYFYHGNPELSPERSTQIELNVIRQNRQRSFGIESALFFNYMRNFIDGKPQSDIFQRYVNYSSAVTAGGEISLYWSPADYLEMASGASYVFAENLELNEPLPMTPPLEGFINMAWQANNFGLDGRVRGVARQERIADQTTNETPTDGFITVDLSGRYKISDQLELRAGVNNLMDAYYREHTSTARMPSTGRDIYLRLGYSW